MSNRNATTRNATTSAPSDEAQHVEAAEASSLNAATASLDEAARLVEEQNERLQRLIARRRMLAGRLRVSLAEARVERRSIEKEIDDILRPTPRRARTSAPEAAR